MPCHMNQILIKFWFLHQCVMWSYRLTVCCNTPYLISTQFIGLSWWALLFSMIQPYLHSFQSVFCNKNITPKCPLSLTVYNEGTCCGHFSSISQKRVAEVLIKSCQKSIFKCLKREVSINSNNGLMGAHIGKCMIKPSSTYWLHHQTT